MVYLRPLHSNAYQTELSFIVAVLPSIRAFLSHTLLGFNAELLAEFLDPLTRGMTGRRIAELDVRPEVPSNKDDL